MTTASGNPFRLDGKVTVLTGASKGIGLEMARLLAEQGAQVVISSRKQEAVDQVAETFRQDGLEATGIACHVGEEEQLNALVDQTVDRYGGIDILVNNAATNPVFGPLLQADGALFEKIMAVNVKGPMLLSNLVQPLMAERGGGSVIHISSVEGIKPSFGLGVYSVSKAALISLTQAQAREWGGAGIRVNVICPGLVKTKFSAALWQNEAILKQIEQNLPLGRMAMPGEMAGLALFLASEASSYCTGSIFTADGGHLIA
jgi:NAD(P)-dependent dehydrogenase (short-subunit alcohol dehydrogenase family)